MPCQATTAQFGRSLRVGSARRASAWAVTFARKPAAMRLIGPLSSGAPAADGRRGHGAVHRTNLQLLKPPNASSGFVTLKNYGEELGSIRGVTPSLPFATDPLEVFCQRRHMDGSDLWQNVVHRPALDVEACSVSPSCSLARQRVRTRRGRLHHDRQGLIDLACA